MPRKAFKRADLIKFFANLAPCPIGMEECGGALHCSKPHTRRGPGKREPSFMASASVLRPMMMSALSIQRLGAFNKAALS